MSKRRSKSKAGAGFLSALASILNFFLIVARGIGKTALVSYLARYWVLLAILALVIALALSNVLFRVAGTLIYLPALSLGSLATALLLRNVFNRDTTDADADSGKFVAEWNALDPKTRVVLAVVQILVYFTATAIIAAALIR